MKKTLLSCLFIFMTLAISLHGGENLLQNSSFISSNAMWPNQWQCEQNITHNKNFSTSGGILRITEESPNYYNAVSQTVKIDGKQSYFFSVSYRNDGSEFPSGIFYTFLDAAGKPIRPEAFLVRTNHSSADWIVLKKVLSSPDPLRTAAVKITFVQYSRRGKLPHGLAVKTPLLEKYVDQDLRTAPSTAPANGKKSTEAASPLPPVLFSHNLTNGPKWMPYTVERGECGFLRIDSPYIGSQKMELIMQVPQGVSIELHILQHNSKRTLLLPFKTTPDQLHYIFPPSCRWNAWGNVIIFSPKANTPSSFSLHLSWRAPLLKQEWKNVVKVEVIPAETTVQPKKLHFSSWQDFPLSRIDITDPANILAIKMANNWRRTNWRPNRELRATKFFPHKVKNWSGLAIPIPPGVTATGAPSDLFCDSALIAAGAEFQAGLIRQAGGEAEVKSHTQFEYDYEPYVCGPVTSSCFCRNCRKEFTDRYHLPYDLTPLQILQKHEKSWVQFRMAQRATAVKTAAAGVKLINPAIKFRFCSMPLPPDKENEASYFKEYGIDMRLYRDFTDIFTPMNYGGNLDFYRSLEREAVELPGERSTIISNGWGDISSINPKRCAAQLFAAFYCRNDYPSLGQGMFMIQGALLAELKKTMRSVAAAEDIITSGRIDSPEQKINARILHGPTNALYSISATLPDKRRTVLLINNNERQTIYVEIPLPRSGITVQDVPNRQRISHTAGTAACKLPPLSFKLLELNGPMRPDFAEISATVIANEAKNLRLSSRAKNLSFNRDNMSITPDAAGHTVTVRTPAQELKFSLHDSAVAAWTCRKQQLSTGLAKLFFIDQGSFDTSGMTAELIDSSTDAKSITVTFRSVITNKPYDKLAVYKSFRIGKNIPELKITVKIVPEGAFRMFRCRLVNIFSPGREQPKEAVQYRQRLQLHTGNIVDKQSKPVSFVRSSAKFPDGKPFLAKYAVKTHIWHDNKATLRDSASRSGVELTCGDKAPDQLFCWRDNSCGTLELIYPDAYPVNDPHLIGPWSVEYGLRYVAE